MAWFIGHVCNAPSLKKIPIFVSFRLLPYILPVGWLHSKVKGEEATLEFLRCAHLLSPSILLEVLFLFILIKFLYWILLTEQFEEVESENIIVEIAKFIACCPSNVPSLGITFVWFPFLPFGFMDNSRPRQNDSLSDISEETLICLFKSVAENHVLTKVEMTGPAWSRFDSCQGKIMELLWENFTLKYFWYLQSEPLHNFQKDVSFDSVTNRNKFLRKQQRFRTTKALAPQ